MKPLLLAVLFMVSILVPTVFAAETTPPATEPKPPAFLILLRLVPRLHDGAVWTKEEHDTVARHFQRLKEARDHGQVVLAGRTEESLDRTIGLVVFTAKDEAAAREFMNGDPCVAAGIMTGELRPYSIALLPAR